ncbi:MAG: hypothetical protein WAK75_09030 [Methanoregula sp.]|uniref:hypothetical protein n=1 Tax=Methanoregula sp. TaxID=2052170 RepID=UPI003BAFAA32
MVEYMGTMRVVTENENAAHDELIAKVNASSNLSDEEKKAITESPNAPKDTDGMLSALSKLIPVPVMTVYTLLDGTFRSLSPVPTLGWLCFFIVCCFFTVWITWAFTEGPKIEMMPISHWSKKYAEKNDPIAEYLKTWNDNIRNQRLKQTVVVMIAFIAYVMAIGGPFPTLYTIAPWAVWQGYYGTVALGIVTLIVYVMLPKTSTQ